MQRALILILVLAVTAFVVGCNPPSTTETAAAKSAGAKNPDGSESKNGGGQTLQAEK